MNPRQRHLLPPVGHFFLFGPRGTGKSTYLNQKFPQAHRIDLLRPDVRLRLESNPAQLRHDLLALPSSSAVVLDEVQRLPILLDTVHELIEQRHISQFAMTGSSVRKLRQKGVNLLAGRALVANLHPYMASEIGSDFQLEQALNFGMVPLIVESPAPAETLYSYLATYLEQEVRAEGLVRNAGTFARVLQALAFSQGQPINASNLAHDCAVDRRTVATYVEILRDLLLVYDVEPFTHRARRDSVATSRLFWFDCGVLRATRRMGQGDSEAEMDGVVLEGLVAQHLRAWLDYTGMISGKKHQLNFWRTRGGMEVDFILSGPLGFWAIEVKNSTRIRPDDLKGLQAFVADYPEATPLLIYRGPADRIGPIPCISAEAFLAHLRPGLPIPSTPEPGLR